jgi:Histidine kinase
MDEVLGKNMHDLIHHTRANGTPFPVEECRVHRVARTGEGVHAEDEVQWRANRASFPVEYWSYPQRRAQEVVGAVAAFVDITERKIAEAALANVSRKLIEAQEQERIRIGRELHDDIGQRLALLAVQLQQLNEDTFILPEVRSRMGETQQGDFGDSHRYSILITRVAFGKTAIFGYFCGHERLLPRIRRAASGTTIHARVPLSSGGDSVRAAGQTSRLDFFVHLIGGFISGLQES